MGRPRPAKKPHPDVPWYVPLGLHVVHFSVKNEDFEALRLRAAFEETSLSSLVRSILLPSIHRHEPAPRCPACGALLGSSHSPS